MQSTTQREFPSLEQRIQAAHAQRSVEMGYMIGTALAAVWGALASAYTALQTDKRLSYPKRFVTHR
jgi:hypothetical protein